MLPAPEAFIPPIASPETSPAFSAAFCCTAVTAAIEALRGTSCPLLTARSKTMPSFDSVFCLVLALASVTCPKSFEPLAMTTLPSDLTSEVALATTSSPGLAFFASTGLERTA